MRKLTILVSLLLVLAGCGDDEPTSTAQKAGAPSSLEGSSSVPVQPDPQLKRLLRDWECPNGNKVKLTDNVFDLIVSLAGMTQEVKGSWDLDPAGDLRITLDDGTKVDVVVETVFRFNEAIATKVSLSGFKMNSNEPNRTGPQSVYVELTAYDDALGGRVGFYRNVGPTIEGTGSCTSRSTPTETSASTTSVGATETSAPDSSGEDQARACKVQVRTILTAFEAYKETNGAYPKSFSDLTTPPNDVLREAPADFKFSSDPDDYKVAGLGIGKCAGYAGL